MKKLLFLLTALLLLAVPVTVVLTQDGEQPTGPTIEVAGVDTVNLPEAVITVNVFDSLGQPAPGLGVDDFSLGGEAAEFAEIVRVESVTDANLPLSIVLVIDTSSSMSGRPIEQAQAAARVFVENLRETDQVAILTFDSTVREVQGFTRDTQTLLNAINSLTFGGQTALYDATLAGVELAADAPTTRRVVVLLSDGAEYGTPDGAPASVAARDDALNIARIRGVPVYTIGLGYGIDRSYLLELATGTNSSNIESPEPDALPGIYGNLADRLRSQYVLTLDFDVPLDGTEYPLELSATTDEGTVTATTTTLRAPIPVPLVSVEGVPDAPVSEPITLNFSVAADDPITAATINDEPVEVVDGSASYPVDPGQFSPGPLTVEFAVTDEDGDTASQRVDLEIAALPSMVNFPAELDGIVIDSPTEIAFTITGQTPPTTVTVAVAGGEGQTLTPDEEGTYRFVLDPAALQPGPNTFTVTVTNEAGVTSTSEAAFTVAALPPVVTLSGITDGQVFEDSYLPGDTVTVSVSAESQTAITGVRFLIDGVEAASLTEPPYTYDVSLFEIGPGPHTLEAEVTNAGAASASASVTFDVVFVATPTPTATVTPTPTIDFQATAIAESTANAQRTGTAQAALDAIATEDANATAAAQSTADAQATEDANATAAAQSTADAQATVDANATTAAQSTADAQATEDANATAAAQATDDALIAQAAANVRATEDARATFDAQARATLDAQEQATTDAQSTADANATQSAQATADADATQSAQATADADATQSAQATADANATQSAQATADANATQSAQATADADATQSAQATADAQSTADADATQSAQATADANATATEVQAVAMQPTATPEPTATPTEEPTSTATDEPTATSTATPQPSSTATDEPTVTPTDEPTATDEPTVTSTATPEPTSTATIAPTETPEPTSAPSATPVTLTEEFDAEQAPEDDQDLLPLVIGGICGGILLIFAILFLARRRNREG